MDKKGFVIDNLGWLILGIITILVVFLLVIVFKQPMQKLMDIITGVIRFG